MAATFSKPTKIPEWADTGTIVEPSEGKKDTGWTFEEAPPFSYFNWHQNLVGSWVKWIDERFADGATKDDLEIIHPGDGIPGIELLSGEVRFLDDADLSIEIVGSDVRINLGSDDWIQFNRAGGPMEFRVNGTDELQINPGEVAVDGDLEVLGDAEIRNVGINQGLDVGFSGTQVADVIRIGNVDFRVDGSTANTPRIWFDLANNDEIFYNRTTNVFEFRIAGTAELSVDASAILIDGNEIQWTSAAGGLLTGIAGGSSDALTATGGPTGGDGVRGIGGQTSGSATGGNFSGGAPNGIGVEAFGLGTGSGLECGGGATGYGAICQGNSTRAPLRLIPQASAPSSGQEGDIYMDTDGKLYVHNGSTFVVVGTQT